MDSEVFFPLLPFSKARVACHKLIMISKCDDRNKRGGVGVKQGVEDIISFPHCRRQYADETMKDKKKKAELSISLEFFHLTKLQ